MREEHIIHLLEIPIGGKDGFVWNRLHAEREDTCEALVKEETESSRKILQTRLRKVDDALDRLMSGSYGICSQCGSALPGSAFNGGAIAVGGRLEMWVDERVFLTSPVKTVEVQQCSRMQQRNRWKVFPRHYLESIAQVSRDSPRRV